MVSKERHKMNRKTKTAAFILMAGVMGISYADNSAMECLSTRWDGDKLYFTNVCDYNIYVMYCTTEVKTSGKYCGDYAGSKGEKGSYYTHTFNLKVGTEDYKWKPRGIKYGACKGMTGFGRQFSDYEDGRYSCEEPKRLYE